MDWCIGLFRIALGCWLIMHRLNGIILVQRHGNSGL
jgi:hypothetical protein